MYRKLAVALAAPFLLSAAPVDPRTINDGTPPVRYHADNAAVVYFLNPADLQIACGGPAPPGYVFAGCSGQKNGVPIIVLPNPCLFDSQSYAHIACHELGHRNGWPGTHDE